MQSCGPRSKRRGAKQSFRLVLDVNTREPPPGLIAFTTFIELETQLFFVFAYTMSAVRRTVTRRESTPPPFTHTHISQYAGGGCGRKTACGQMEGGLQQPVLDEATTNDCRLSNSFMRTTAIDCHAMGDTFSLSDGVPVPAFRGSGE
ncbi:unnamed protein product [Protopolystoma xenopodis]|uniref:Uncharacterized protein n=1 Tax=Protopolystoma xenopodis TaxID=117903 RepID=A0A448XHS1_9PLAT|nr:unnamed protein product [Protopolystoma xenopodis]